MHRALALCLVVITAASADEIAAVWLFLRLYCALGV